MATSDAGGRKMPLQVMRKRAGLVDRKKKYQDLIRTGRPGTEEPVGRACVKHELHITCKQTCNLVI